MKMLPRAGFPGLGASVLALGIALSACGGSSAPATPKPTNQFPNTQTLPAVQIKDRVINLNARSGYQYAKLSLSVVFEDPKGVFAKAKGENLKKLQEAFTADNPALISAFNDVLTTDVSQKSPQELTTPEGKETLRKQLIADFNARLAPPAKPGEESAHVVYVNFVDFVMQ